MSEDTGPPPNLDIELDTQISMTTTTPGASVGGDHLNEKIQHENPPTRLVPAKRRRSEWGAQSWNKQRGLLNWPFENKVTTPECVTSECSCCFHTCPSYTVQLVTVTPSSSFQVTEGNTITLSSCLIPSVAVDRTKLFVLRSGKFQIYSDAGAELFTWESDKLEYAGTTANRNREQDFMMSNPAEQNHYSDSEQSVHQWSTRMGGQIALDNRHAFLVTPLALLMSLCPLLAVAPQPRCTSLQYKDTFFATRTAP